MGLIYIEEKDFKEEELEELFLSAGWASGKYPQKLAAALRGYGYVLAARDNGRLVGLAGAMDDGVMTAYVHYLLVLPEYRGMGLGAQLIGRAVVEYRVRGMKTLRLNVASSNKKAQHFYERLGFIRDTPLSKIVSRQQVMKLSIALPPVYDENP